MRTSSLIAISSLILFGCGAMGGTKQFAMGADQFAAVQPGRPIAIGAVTLEPNAAGMQAVGAMPIGAFNSSDLAVLKESLNASALSAPSRTADSRLTIDVAIRKHLVAASNNAGGGLAAVAWRLRDGQRIAYSDDFYVSSSGMFVTSVGAIKDAMNRSIVSRVVLGALALADEDERTQPPAQGAGAFDDFDSAIEELPASLTGLPPPGWIYVLGNPTAPALWTWARVGSEMRWPE